MKEIRCVCCGKVLENNNMCSCAGEKKRRAAILEKALTLDIDNPNFDIGTEEAMEIYNSMEEPDKFSLAYKFYKFGYLMGVDSAKKIQ